MSLDIDLADLFDDDTCIPVTRTRLLAADVPFLAIVGLSDEDTLDGHVRAPMRQMAWATGPDVREGDTLVIDATGQAAIHNGSYRVLEPRRVNDGAESRALLQLMN